MNASNGLLKAGDATTRRAFVSTALAGLFSLGSLTGCSTSPPVHMVAAIDYSSSCSAYLPAFVQKVTSLPGRLAPDQDHLTVLRLAHTLEEILDGRSPESADRLKSILVPQVKLASVPGTMSGLLWKDLAQRLSSEQHPTAIAVFSDADNDAGTAASWAEIKQSVDRLAANPKVLYVGIYGVRASNREAIRANFVALGDRLHLFDIREMTLDPLFTELDNARQPSRR